MNPAFFLRRRGLGAYLALAFAILSGLLTLILVAVIGVTASDQVRTDIGANLAELAAQSADKVDRGMFERYREIELLSRRFSAADQAAGRAMLDDMRTSFPYYAWIGATGIDGRVLVATDGLLEGADVSARPWYRNAQRQVHIGDVHEAVLLAGLLPETTGDPRRFVDIAFPYLGSKAQPAGVLGAQLSWEWAAEVAGSVIEPGDGPQVLVVNASQVVLLGPAQLQGQRLETGSARASGDGSTIETWPDGREYLVGYSAGNGHADYPGLGWKVLVRQDAQSAFAPVSVLQKRVFWSGALVAVLFSLFGVWMARHISRPLEALSAAAANLEQGRSTVIPEMPDQFSEVRTLSTSLASLMMTLQVKEAALTWLNQTLEERVEGRTTELALALADVREAEARVHGILDASQDAFIAFGLDGTISDWNLAAEKMFGMTKHEALGQSVTQAIVQPHLRQRLIRTIAAVDAEGNSAFASGRLELLVSDRNGREFYVECSIGWAGNADSGFFCSFLHDISERKQVEKMKAEFVATVSHELRTPLTSIRFSLNMLADGSMGVFDPDVQKLLDIANDSCERLVRLINTILDIEKIESGQIAYHFVAQPLRPLVEAAMASMRSFALQFDVTLRLEDDGSAPQAAVDVDRLTQVVVNLLSNAAKYSPRGGEVVVRLETRLDTVRLSVSDHGDGIPVAFRSRVFEKFAQADSSNTRTRDGTGLGLSICRQLVRAHGGQIHFTSSYGEGTTFHVDLPLA